MNISSLHIYPIKSLAGILVHKVKLSDTGFEMDRKWMLVDENDTFISQRNFPAMTQYEVSMIQQGIQVSYENESIIIPYKSEGNTASYTLWQETVKGIRQGKYINDWFSDTLKHSVQLIHQFDLKDRKLAQDQNTVVSYADSSQLLITNTASLAELNTRLQAPITMDRFRPNIVIDHSVPYEEDHWQNIHINGNSLVFTKLCSRCRIITTNQKTGVRDPEPLNVLSTYRKIDRKIMFGSFYRIAEDTTSEISVDSKIEMGGVML